MKAIITVVGCDRTGIIAGVSRVLAENGVNIEDISQTVMKNNFTMIMYVDIDESKATIEGLSALLAEEGKKLGVETQIRNAEIFTAMHRL